jgi:hypothetical protein
MRTRGFLICLSTVLLSVSPCFSQIEWEKFYGGDKYEFANRLLELSDHNLLICSYTQSYGAGDADIWIIKITPKGDTIWTKTYGGPKYECANAVHELRDGSILVAGNTASFVSDTQNCAWDIWLLKLTANGDTVWTKTFYGNRTAGVAMVVDDQENIFLAANSVKDDPEQNCQIIKCRKDGHLEWIKYYGGAGYENLESFCRTSDGSLLLLMTSQSFSPKTMWLFKISPDGTALWNKTFGGNFSYGNASDIIEMPNGTYMLSGYNGSTTTTTLFILNMAADGTVRWQKNYSQFTSNWAPSFTLLSSGNFFIYAIEDAGRGRQIRLIRMNDTGAVLWTDVIGDTGSYSIANSFLETSDGRFLMLGGTNRVTKAADDLWLVSLTPDMYINMGGKFEYHLVNNSDSSTYTYTILSAPPQMKVSGGGTLEWVPQNATASSELVSVALSSGSKKDTIGFIIHVNKARTAIEGYKIPLHSMTNAQGPGITICVSSTNALITAPSEQYTADIYALNGTKVVSLSKTGAGGLSWNLRDFAGRSILPGKYVVSIAGKGMGQFHSMITIMH